MESQLAGRTLHSVQQGVFGHGLYWPTEPHVHLAALSFFLGCQEEEVGSRAGRTEPRTQDLTRPEDSPCSHPHTGATLSPHIPPGDPSGPSGPEREEADLKLCQRLACWGQR